MKPRIITSFKLFFFSILFFSCIQNVPFDSQKWKECGESYDCILGDTRLKMTKNLIESKILLQKKKSEVEAILGSPSRYTFTSENTKGYEVKEEYEFLNIDPCITYLEITFDEDGLAKSVKMKKQQT